MGSSVGPKAIMHALLLLVLLQQSSSLVGAVDITFYERTCSGSGSSCIGIDSYTCCVTSDETGAVSVLTDYGAGCLGADYYNSGDCSNGDYIDTTNGNFCYYDGYFTAAYWFDSCNRRRSLLGEKESKTPACTRQMKPNAIVFTEDSTKGHWMLNTSNVELFSQFKNVNDAEKLDWIKSKGASYKARDSNMHIESKQQN